MNISALIFLFRKRTRFDETATSPATRAKLLLYFVTCVAKLRDDMTAAVIHERLYDWGYDDIDANGIKQSFVVDPDVRTSKERDGAYEINPAAGQRLTDEFGPAKLSIAGWQARFLRVPVLLSFVCLTVAATVGTYHLATQRQGPRDLSWDEFRTRSGFDKKSTTSPIRAKFFLFYITEYVRLRYDMEPAVVSDRLSDLGFTNSLPDEIKAAFDKDTDIIVLINVQEPTVSIHGLSPSSTSSWTFRNLPRSISRWLGSDAMFPSARGLSSPRPSWPWPLPRSGLERSWGS